MRRSHRRPGNPLAGRRSSTGTGHPPDRCPAFRPPCHPPEKGKRAPLDMSRSPKWFACDTPWRTRAGTGPRASLPALPGAGAPGVGRRSRLPPKPLPGLRLGNTPRSERPPASGGQSDASTNACSGGRYDATRGTHSQPWAAGRARAPACREPRERPVRSTRDGACPARLTGGGQGCPRTIAGRRRRRRPCGVPPRATTATTHPSPASAGEGASASCWPDGRA